MTEPENPILECDLVMKGGIASGLVYPKAVAELSRRYRFRGIAGTSAGAIAAAVSAAAEYGRQQGVRCRHDGKEVTPFERLAAIPAELASGKPNTKLSQLFQPQPNTARYFKIALKGLTAGLRPIVFFLIKICSRGVILTSVVALLIGWAVGGPVGVVLAVAIGVPCAILAAVLSARKVVRALQHAIPENLYGLCTGRTVPGHSSPGLTDWLHELIQSLAGRSVDTRPLTMGDLWLLGNYNPEQRERLEGKESREIDLQLMTSNITQGRSHRFPNLMDWSGSLYFKREEFERLFPQAVVEWMVEKGRRTHPFADESLLSVPEGYYHLPWAEHLPVLFGARISLSFPFVLSAVPLYVFDLSILKDIEESEPPSEHAAYLNTLAEGKAADPAAEARWNEYWTQQMQRVPLKRCWFSDGGVTSNFPIHFFDGPLARRPTFAINLTTPTTKIINVGAPEAGGQARDKAWDYIFMPTANEDGAARVVRFNDFEKNGNKLIGFFSALFDTSRNWSDTEQIFMPSYRDRIVHVMLEPHEGGLNLEMPASVIESIGHRGRLAAQLLLARFDPHPAASDPKSGRPIVLTWNNHRWVRYRTFMAAIEQLLIEFGNIWKEERDHPERLPPGVVPLPELVKQASRELMSSPDSSCVTDYWWRSPEQMQHAQRVSETLAEIVASWTGPEQSFDAEAPPEYSAPPSRICGRSPLPKPTLRVVPSYDLVMGWGIPSDDLPEEILKNAPAPELPPEHYLATE